MKEDLLEFEQFNLSVAYREDSRYDVRAYEFLNMVILNLPDEDEESSDESESNSSEASAEQIKEAFRKEAIGNFGPFAYYVLHSWGVTCCKDIGNMMRALCKTKVILKSPGDQFSDFDTGFDFYTEFCLPALYKPKGKRKGKKTE